MARCVLLTSTPECVASPRRAITRAAPSWSPGAAFLSSNRNASRDESVETGDEYVEAGDESIEAGEKHNNHVINIEYSYAWRSPFTNHQFQRLSRSIEAPGRPCY